MRFPKHGYLLLKDQGEDFIKRLRRSNPLFENEEFVIEPVEAVIIKMKKDLC